MIPRSDLSFHGNLIRYRGEDVAVLLDASASATDAFLTTLGAITDADRSTLEQDITDLEQELEFLKLEVAKALKFVDKWPAKAKEILTRISCAD